MKTEINASPRQRLRGFLRRRWGWLVLAAVVVCVPFVIESYGGTGLVPTWDQLHSALGVPLETLPAAEQGDGTLVAVLDVGQGDAVLIVQDGKACLIDTGTHDSREALLNNLHQAGVETLDYLILTHPHSDHTGGVLAVLEEFPVQQLLLPAWEPRDETDADWPYQLQEKAADRGAAVITTAAGQQYPLGSGMLTILQSVRLAQESEADDGGESESASANNASVCTLFTAGDFRFLDTGDAEAAAERALVDTYGTALRADLMKAGHHGSSTSNTADFLQVVTPQAVAISCGADNDYGHPHQAALRNFAEVGAAVYRTDTQGTIVFTLQDGVLTATAEKQAEQDAA